MKSEPSLFIFAGEHSGDLHGSRLLAELRKIRPELQVVGVGGPRMRREGMDCIIPMEDFQVMGFSDVIKAFPKLLQHFYKVRDYILTRRPAAVVLIDYPGFNLRLAKALRRKGYTGKIIQYICPSVWAWGKKRIPQMAETLDLLMTIYPFEADCFSKTSLKVKYVGNPLTEMIDEYQHPPNWREELKIHPTDDLIGIFPGSRESEISRNFPKQLEAAKMLKNQPGKLRFGISVANDGLLPILQYHIERSGLRPGDDIVLVPSTHRYELMRNCRTAIAKSGTITLELALHQVPTVVIYELSSLNRFVAKYLLRLNLPHYCIVNILAGAMVFPELIVEGFTPSVLYQQVKLLNSPGVYRDACKSACLHLKQILQTENPNKKAASAILELI